MASPSDIVKKHYDAAFAEGAAQSIPAELLTRTFFAFVIQSFREHLSPEDLKAELENTLENIDPDQEYTFMRP